MRSTCSGKEFVLGAAGLELLRGVEDEHLVLPILLLALAEDEDAGGQAGAVKQVWAEADDGFEQIHAENLFPDRAFLAHAEQGAVRQDHGHAPGRWRHALDHVLHPGVIAALAGRHAGEIPAIRIAGPDFLAPFFQRERRIGDHTVKGGEVVAGEKCRAAERIAPHDLKVRRAMQEQVHAGDGGGGEVLLLPEELCPRGCGRRHGSP